MNKALFLDRDGVINEDKKYLYKIENFLFCEGIFELISTFLKKDFLIFVVTNQSGIGRGYYTKENFLKLTEWMLEKFSEKNIKITKVYYCPHSPSENCQCRKPNNKMFKDAIKEFDIDVQNSWMIGDKISDIQAANKSHIKNSILINKEYQEAKFKVKDVFEIVKLLKEGKINL